MIRGLYSAASGMMLGLTRMDALSNNLANVNTCGFKKDVVVSTAFPDMLISRLEKKDNGESGSYQQIGNLGTGACAGLQTSDFSQGNMKRTDNPLDIALANSSYFVVQTANGERFTRNGQFKLTGTGLLTDMAGNPVMDVNDEQIVVEGDLRVDKQGNVFVNGEELTTLKIVTFADQMNSMVKMGGSLWQSNTPYTEDANPQVLQNYVEDSNVNAVSEMIELIKVTRSYESLQKIVQAEDESLATVIEKVGTAR